MNNALIKDAIDRFMALERHRDKTLEAKVFELEDWKLQQQLRCYAPLMRGKAESRLLHYYFKDVFCGVDLSEFKNADMATHNIDRFFTGVDMLESGLHFNALTQETNEAIAGQLLSTKAGAGITEAAYSEACHAAGVLDDMQSQLDVFSDFVDDLNNTVSNKAVITAVKLAKYPAKLGGFTQLYSLVADGLSYLKDVDDPEAIAAEFIRHERSIVNNIAAGKKTPFTLIAAG